jgi:hypothetical protein
VLDSALPRTAGSEPPGADRSGTMPSKHPLQLLASDGPGFQTLNHLDFWQAQCSFVIEKYNNCCQAAIVKFGEGEEGCRAARAAKGERV